MPLTTLQINRCKNIDATKFTTRWVGFGAKRGTFPAIEVTAAPPFNFNSWGGGLTALQFHPSLQPTFQVEG